jgi:hypothetical protein
LKECGWTSRNGSIDSALIWQLFTGETGLTPEAMLAGGYLPDPTYDTYGPDDYFVHDQRPRGFAALLDMVAAGALDPPHPDSAGPGSARDERGRGHGSGALGDGRLVLGAHVDRVEYKTCGGGVTVSAADNRSWTAKYVISTLSLGILQRLGGAGGLFSPPIPPPQMQVMRKYVMANYTKIFVQWPADGVWWNTSIYKWAQANGGANGGDLPSVRNLGHPSLKTAGSNTLFFDLGDPQSTRWENMADEEAEEELLRTLRGQHPDVRIGKPSAFHITRHSVDPLTYGAYSAWALTTDEDHAMFSKPLSPSASCASPSVFLSGEAMCANMNGFVHGGLLAGRRDAGTVLKALGYSLAASAVSEQYGGVSPCDA